MTVMIVFGVAGSGKTTVGQALGQRMGLPFADGDDFHPPSNVEKMAAGRPLSDTDRWPWLSAIRSWMSAQETAVVACSALRRSYRDYLRPAGSGYLRPARFVYLKISRSLAAQRLANRHGHFFNPALLDSQFAGLEEPGPDEDDLLIVEASSSVEDLVQFILDNISGLPARDA